MTDSVTEALERLDRDIIQPYLVDGWEMDQLRRATVYLLFGKVSFHRRRLRKAGQKSFPFG